MTAPRFAWSDDRERFFIKGQILRVTPVPFRFLSLIAAADCAWVQPDDLRLFEHLERPRAIAKVIVHRLREAFERHGVNCPIETGYRLGYRWNPDAPRPVILRAPAQAEAA